MTAPSEPPVTSTIVTSTIAAADRIGRTDPVTTADRVTGRIAVIGAGPSGLYTVAALLAGAQGLSVDVFDRLPTPYGLVRYGVAPDHVKMKSVIRVLRNSLEHNDVRFFGNVWIGDAHTRGDLTTGDLTDHYHAVVHATGSQLDRELEIDGEDLPGSFGAGQFVNWYCGHPDASADEFPLHSDSVVVVGAGNVALDVARVLAKSGPEMAATDVPDRVLDALHGSRVREVHMLIRRGPQHVRFTPPELRAIGDLPSAGVRLHDHGELAEEPGMERRAKQILGVFREWAARPDPGKPRTIHLRFYRSPVRMLGSGRLAGVVVERNALSGGRLAGTGETETIPAGMLVRAVGYRAAPVPGLPFDERSGTVPHEAGRVMAGDKPVTGRYVTGWVKRGPTGVIGTNKGDGTETANAVLADLSTLPEPAHPDRAHLVALLDRRGVHHIDWPGWLLLDADEMRRGVVRGGAERVKAGDLASMLAASRRPDREADPS